MRLNVFLMGKRGWKHQGYIVHDDLELPWFKVAWPTPVMRAIGRVVWP